MVGRAPDGVTSVDERFPTSRKHAANRRPLSGAWAAYARLGVCGPVNVVSSLAALLLAATAPPGAAHDVAIWFSGYAPTVQALAIADLLRRAEEKGLRPADYGAAE